MDTYPPQTRSKAPRLRVLVPNQNSPQPQSLPNRRRGNALRKKATQLASRRRSKKHKVAEADRRALRRRKSLPSTAWKSNNACMMNGGSGACNFKNSCTSCKAQVTRRPCTEFNLKSRQWLPLIKNWEGKLMKETLWVMENRFTDWPCAILISGCALFLDQIHSSYRRILAAFGLKKPPRSSGMNNLDKDILR